MTSAPCLVHVDIRQPTLTRWQRLLAVSETRVLGVVDSAARHSSLHHLHRYEVAIVSLKAKVKESEGEDMREAIQDKVGMACCQHPQWSFGWLAGWLPVPDVFNTAACVVFAD